MSFFPHLLAGPILHHQEMMPQFADQKNQTLDYGNVWRGLCLFGIGLSKKVLLADMLAPYVRFGFDAAPSLSLVEAWLTTAAYSFQIYFDFSGYTDMAIGAALLLNIKLPFNFNSPYRSLDIQSFWRRWHITLGTFFRDYIYIPLGGSRVGGNRTLLNIFAVALLSGLWHGAAWSFVIWGGLHGLAMVVCNVWKRLARPLARPLAWLVTIGFVSVSWVFFRARDWKQATDMLGGMAGLHGVVLFAQLERVLKPLRAMGVEFKPLAINEVGKLLCYLAVACAIALWPRNSNALLDESFVPARWQLVGAALITGVCLLNLNQLSEFIYFNF